MIRRPVQLCMAIALATATGAAAQEPAPRAPPAAGAAPAPKTKAWDDMNKDEKKAVMKKVVVPKMTALFKEFDAEKYKQVRCTLCHGEQAKKDKFGMPNPDLPKLDFANHLSKERAEKP